MSDTVKISPGQELGGLWEVEEYNPSEEEQADIVHAVKTGAPSPAGKDRRTSDILNSISIDKSSLSVVQRNQVENLVSRFHHLFAISPSELGHTNLVEHSINTGDHPPIKQPVRRLPFALRHTVEDMVKDMLEQGVVRKSKSPWASPVVLVRKKDESVRFCVDYRKLNAVTKKDVFPLPRIDDALDLLANSKYFSTLDLASGYWQVTMDSDSQEKTAFTTHRGLYEFSVMPFGLCNAPATFQRLMKQVLDGLIGQSCMVYLDDVLVIGKNFEEQLENLEKVFLRLEKAGLRLKPKKCNLAQTKVEYLGYVVSEEGITADEKKVRAIMEFPVPTNIKSLKSFLGLASYYRRFVPCFSKIAHPLHQLTRKDVEFVWNGDCQVAFEKLKTALTDPATLAFPKFDRDFILETDASTSGLGAVLSQAQVKTLPSTKRKSLKDQTETVRPIAYASRTLQAHEQNYGITELEALAVVWAVKHFRPYIYGQRCRVITDHQALKSLLNTPQPSGKLARWGMALQDVDVTIEYRAGRKNEKADALSRYPVKATTTADSHDPDTVIAATTAERATDPPLKERQRDDPSLKSVIDYLEQRVLPSEEKEAREILLSEDHYTLVDDVLFRVVPDKSLRIVPPTAERKSLWEQLHAGCYGGHLKSAKAHGQLARQYWWPGMRTDIAHWCRGCVTCATRGIGRKLNAPLTPIPVGGPFDRVGVDIIKLPKSSRGNQYAVVFMDYLTKWPEVFPVKNQTALIIAKLLVENIICRHGVPTELLSDRGANFLSNLMHEVYRLMGIRKVNTTAYHPQTDGLVERFNRTLTEMLAKTAKANGKDWDLRLPYVLFSYRTSPQASTGESPFYLLYGRDPQLPTEAALNLIPERDQLDVDDYKTDLTEKLAGAWDLARQNIKKAQRHQKQMYDRHAKDPPVKRGDRVFIYMPAADQGPSYKFARPFHGPYRVVEKQPNTILARPVDQPQATPIRVSLSRVRMCPQQIPDVFWPRKEKVVDGSSDVDKPEDISGTKEAEHDYQTDRDYEDEQENAVMSTEGPDEDDTLQTVDADHDEPSDNPWKNRLRKRKGTIGTIVADDKA